MSLVGEWDIIGTTRENSSIYVVFKNYPFCFRIKIEIQRI